MKTTEVGMNRTGMGSAPMSSKKMKENTQEGANLVPTAMIEQRESYIAESDPIGTVPIPTTFKGVSSTLMQRLKGTRSEVLIDKLGERLAFERSGARLYELFLQKCEARADESAQIPLDVIRRFHDDEVEHFMLVNDVMKALGADPTSQTPSADVNGVASTGLLQVIADPRTTVPQSLQAILLAELGDNDGWDLLIKLVEELGQDEWATRFREAYVTEQDHLLQIRSIYAGLVLNEAAPVKH